MERKIVAKVEKLDQKPSIVFVLFGMIVFAAMILGLIASKANSSETVVRKHQEKKTHPSVADSAEKVTPLKVGDTISSAKVFDSAGNKYDLKELVNKAPTALIFYRGGWCPYCNTHLEDLVNIEKDLIEEGFQILALSPDKPENVKKSTEKGKFGYTLLSDRKGNAAKTFGVAFKLDDKTVELYKNKYNLDIEEWSGEKHHILPVPSAFLINQEGVVKFVYWSSDYKDRIKAQDLLAKAKEMK